MSLFFLLIVAGKIGGTWGPLPYDRAECEARRTERQAEIEAIIQTGRGLNGNPVPADVLEKVKTWRFVCVEADTRPQLGETRHDR